MQQNAKHLAACYFQRTSFVHMSKLHLCSKQQNAKHLAACNFQSKSFVNNPISYGLSTDLLWGELKVGEETWYDT